MLDMDYRTARLSLHAVDEMEAQRIRDRAPQPGDAWSASRLRRLRRDRHRLNARPRRELESIDELALLTVTAEGQVHIPPVG